VKVYQVLLNYQYLSLSGFQVLLQQSQVLEFVEMFLTHDPTQPTRRLKKTSTQPNPAQLNPTQPMGRPNPRTTLVQTTAEVTPVSGSMNTALCDF